MQTDMNESMRDQQQNAPASQGGEPATQSEPGPEERLSQELEAYRQQVDDLNDKYLRSVAEFANYRKRQEREREQQQVRVSIDVLRKLLPLMDDLDRALAHAPDGVQANGSEMGAWVAGIELIRRKFDAIMDSYGVSAIEAVGKPFDPFFHEAVSYEPSDAFPAGIVIAEVQRGYLIGDQVLRPSLVTVSRGRE